MLRQREDLQLAHNRPHAGEPRLACIRRAALGQPAVGPDRERPGRSRQPLKKQDTQSVSTGQ